MGRLFDIFVNSYALSPEDDKDFFSLIDDLYLSGEVQSMKIYPQHGSVNRLDHIRSVTYMTYILSKRFFLDIKSAVRAAVLHDLVYYDWHDPDLSHRPHGYKHPSFAAFNAKLLNPDITEKEIKIILRHMWPLTPLPPSSKEGFIVSFADKYCAFKEIQMTKSAKLQRTFRKKLGKINSLTNSSEQI